MPSLLWTIELWILVAACCLGGWYLRSNRLVAVGALTVILVVMWAVVYECLYVEGPFGFFEAPYNTVVIARHAVEAVGGTLVEAKPDVVEVDFTGRQFDDKSLEKLIPYLKDISIVRLNLENTSVTCDGRVRTELYAARMPFGKRSRASLGDLVVRSTGFDQLGPGESVGFSVRPDNPDQPPPRQSIQHYEATWDTGLPSAVQSRMSDIFLRDASGTRVGKEQENWFHEQTQHMRRVIVVKILGPYDKDGNAILPFSFGSADTDIGRIAFQVGGDAAKLAGSEIRTLLAVEREQDIRFVIHATGNQK